jgi:hypothetical protein
MPERRIESGNPGLLHCWNLRRSPPARLGHRGVRFNLSIAHEWIAGRSHAQIDIDVPGDKILIQRGSAAIRHEHEFGAGHILEIGPRNVRRSTNADSSSGGVAWICLSQAINSVRSFGGKVFLATMQMGVSANSATGSKSFKTS